MREGRDVASGPAVLRAVGGSGQRQSDQARNIENSVCEELSDMSVSDSRARNNEARRKKSHDEVIRELQAGIAALEKHIQVEEDAAIARRFSETNAASARDLSQIPYFQTLPKPSCKTPVFPPVLKDARMALEMQKKELYGIVKCKKAGTREEQKVCAVCLCELNGRVMALPCAHVYHRECVEEWLKMKLFCPLCKAKVLN